MRKFDSFIYSSNSIDPPLTNSKYTWFNLRIQPTLSRIDRFLYTAGWKNLFSSHYSKTLSRITLDHFLLMLESSSLSWGPPPSRFSNHLIRDNHIKNNFENWWKNTHQAGHSGFSFMRRLK